MSKGHERPSDLSALLLELVHSASQAVDLDGTLEAVLAGARTMVPCDGVALLWQDEDRLKVLASHGPNAALQGLTLPSAQMGAARPVMDGCRPVVIDDTFEDGRWQRVPGEERVRSWLGVPLLVEERAVGVLEWTARLPARFGREDAATAAEIGHHVAPLVRRALLLDDMRRHLRQMTEVPTEPLLPPAEAGPDLGQLAEEAREFTLARHAFVFLVDEEGGPLWCAAAAGDQRERLKYVTLHGDGTFGGWAAPRQRGQGRSGSRATDRATMDALGLETALALPLRVRGNSAGMLGVADRVDGAPFDQDAFRIMTHLASQASMIVERMVQARPAPATLDYEKVVQGSPLALGVLTLTGEVRTCNAGMAELLARSMRSLAGQNLGQFLEPSDARRLAHLIEDVVLQNQRQQVDVRLRTALGENRQVRIYLAPARVAQDDGRDLVAIVEDITPLKILEQERVEHLRELREQHEQLKELDQLKSRFVSNVSHELRTPLAVIKLYAMLARKGRPEKQAHYLQTIEQETQRLEMMVENILDLSWLDRRALQMHPETLAAEEVIAQVIQVYQETAASKEVTLANEVEGTLPPLWADRNHLIQMLTNLVNNALKYTPRGGRVWIAAQEAGTGARRTLEIKVGDTGVGIPEAEQVKVFDRFFRGSNNLPGSTGTGLGLAIVQDLMAQHGGQVTLESESGRGSAFTLYFPLGRGGPAAAAGPRPGQEKQSGTADRA